MKMRLKIALLLIVLAVLALGIGTFSYLKGYAGSSFSRISKEHSLAIPSSADRARCEGLVGLTSLGDFGATADFVVNAADVDKITQQMDDIQEGSEIKERRLNWNYAVPEDFGREVRYLEGVSKAGNIVTLTVYELDGKRVGLCIRTQWN